MFILTNFVGSTSCIIETGGFKFLVHLTESFIISFPIEPWDL